MNGTFISSLDQTRIDRLKAKGWDIRQRDLMGTPVWYAVDLHDDTYGISTRLAYTLTVAETEQERRTP